MTDKTGHDASSCPECDGPCEKEREATLMERRAMVRLYERSR
jgi:hypothetical protein